jgi:hypothetical protein
VYTVLSFFFLCKFDMIIYNFLPGIWFVFVIWMRQKSIFSMPWKKPILLEDNEEIINSHDNARALSLICGPWRSTGIQLVSIYPPPLHPRSNRYHRRLSTNPSLLTGALPERRRPETTARQRCCFCIDRFCTFASFRWSCSPVHVVFLILFVKH